MPFEFREDAVRLRGPHYTKLRKSACMSIAYEPIAPQNKREKEPIIGQDVKSVAICSISHEELGGVHCACCKGNQEAWKA